MFDIYGSLTYIGSIITRTAEAVSCWDKASTIANGVMAGAAVLAACFAWAAWSNSKRTEWREVINTYFKEYRGLEMGRAVDELYRFYRDNGKNPERMIKSYITHVLASDDFHLDTRRKVSALYQEIGALVSAKPRMGEIVHSLWLKSDFDIIVKILLPIEIIANTLAIEERDTWVALPEEEKDRRVQDEVRRNMHKVWPRKDGKPDRTGRPVDIIREGKWDVTKRNMYDLWYNASPKGYVPVTEAEMKSDWWTYEHGVQS